MASVDIRLKLERVVRIDVPAVELALITTPFQTHDPAIGKESVAARARLEHSVREVINELKVEPLHISSIVRTQVYLAGGEAGYLIDVSGEL